MLCLRPLALTAALLGLPLGAQEQEPPTGQDPAVTAEQLEARITAAQDSTELADDVKASVLSNLNQALSLLRQGEASRTRAQQLAADEAAIPQELERIRGELQAEVASPVPDVPADASLTDMQGLATAADEAASRAASELAALETEITERPARRASLPQLLADAQGEQEALPAEPPPADPEAPAALEESRRLLYLAQRAEVQHRLAELQSEQSYFQNAAELLNASRDLAARRATETAQRAEAWRGLVQTRREEEAAAAELRAEQALREARRAHPFLVALAEENQVLVNRGTELAQRFQTTESEIARADTDLQELTDDRQIVDEQLAVTQGLTNAIGVLLRERMQSLPETRDYQRRIADREAAMSRVQLDLLDLTYQRRDLLGPDYLTERMDTLDPPIVDPVERDFIETEARTLLGIRRADLDHLYDQIADYLLLLTRLDTKERQLLEATDAYIAFVREKVLWIRSTEPIWRIQWEEMLEAMGWLCSPENWGALWTDILRDLEPVSPLGLVALILLVVTVLQRRIGRRIQDLGTEARRFSTLSMGPTIQTVLLSALLALPLPLLVFLLSEKLAGDPAVADFSRAVAGGFDGVSFTLLFYLALWHVLRPMGLAEAHFQWSSQTLKVWRRQLRWLPFAAVPSVFVISVVVMSGNSAWQGSLGQVALLAYASAFAAIMYLLLNRKTGIRTRTGLEEGGWFERFRRFWLGLGVGIPAGLFILDVLGYEFTALILAARLRETLAMAALGILVNSLVLRSLGLGRKRLALQQARQRREAAAEATGSIAEAPPPGADETLDLSTVALQTRRLVRATLTILVIFFSWGIWADFFPALSVLEGVELWVDNAVDPPMTITLASLGMAILCVAITLLAARNIPGVLELVILQRLKVRPGDRNAITTITRYTILLVGMIIAFSTIGIGWAKAQWLFAAMSVGLGFGLQEIFANFVSGLIILFERPVRVGDLVTVGTTTVGTTDGFVTRIQMRATTVTDFDRRELVIPNKQFITGSIINWSLSDPMLRVVVKIGVAFGSDVEKAKKILERIADENPLILKKPGPRAVFKKFGEHTLDLELWAYLPSRDERVQASDELHTTIDRELRAAGIEIALPKRDISVHTEPAQDWITQRGAETAPPASVER